MRATPFALAFWGNRATVSRYRRGAAAGRRGPHRPRFALCCSSPLADCCARSYRRNAGADALEAARAAAASRISLLGRRATYLPDQRPDAASRRRGKAHHRAAASSGAISATAGAARLGSPNEASPPEPLDGMFVSAAPSEAGGGAGAISVLVIFGMRPDRPVQCGRT